jgi:hypothetical protein
VEKTREYSTLMKVFIIAFLAIWLNIQTIEAADGSVGYYYPAPNNVESYKARMRVHINTNRFARNNIIKMITNEFLSKPHPPRFVIFTKGTLSEKLIIVSMVKGYLDTTYRARALLEAMTKVVRRSPLFKDIKSETVLNFFDLIRILGFKKITVSDGDKFSYQVSLR